MNGYCETYKAQEGKDNKKNCYFHLLLRLHQPSSEVESSHSLLKKNKTASRHAKDDVQLMGFFWTVKNNEITLEIIGFQVDVLSDGLS